MSYSPGTIGEVVESLRLNRSRSRAENNEARSYNSTYKLAIFKILKYGVRVYDNRTTGKYRLIDGIEISPLLKRVSFAGEVSRRKFRIVERLAARNAKNPWISEQDLVFLRLAGRGSQLAA